MLLSDSIRAKLLFPPPTGQSVGTYNDRNNVLRIGGSSRYVCQALVAYVVVLRLSELVESHLRGVNCVHEIQVF